MAGICSVHFLHKLRDEEKYPDLDTLIQQIERDVEDARIITSVFDGYAPTSRQ